MPHFILDVRNLDLKDTGEDAAVMLVTDSNNLLLILRQQRDGDPWSGQIALPGGFRKLGETLETTALRETEEEVSLNLKCSGYIGSFNTARGTKRVAAFFSIVQDIPSFVAREEVQDAFWVSLSSLVRGKTPFGFPSLDFKSFQVWGLTYRILSTVIREVD